MQLAARIQDRWRGPGGCGEVLRIAFPLILSTGAHAIQMFVDSVLLARHSNAEMAAAMQAGIASFALGSFFLGVATYVNTFVAQYVGAGRLQRVGASVWQGIYFSLAAGVVMLAAIPAARTAFAWMGHGEPHRTYEIQYFQILCSGTWAMLLGASLSSFFTGRGRTWVVCVVNTVATGVNIIGDYALIFGRWGFPEMGVRGAALATVVSGVFAAAAYAVLFFSRRHRETYGTLSGWRPEKDLLRRLMRYGLPNGVQFMLDMLAFNLFVALVGRIDARAFEATTITFRLNILAFMPMIGLGIAVQTLVGQALGQDRPKLAARSTWSAFYVSMTYMTAVAIGYWTVPQWFVQPFVGEANAERMAELAPLVAQLLAFVAFYSLFDTGNIIFAGTLKGAGDTRFVMMLSVGLIWLVMVLPCWLAVRYRLGPDDGLYVAWGFATLYVCLCSLAFLGRFLQGRWARMRVIERAQPGVTAAVAAPIPEPPTAPLESL